MGQTFSNMGWQDRTVKVRRDELLKVLRENLTRHIDDFDEACKGYRAAAQIRIGEIHKVLHCHMDSLSSGKTICVTEIGFTLDMPQSHAKAYDQIIRMMEMCVDNVVELTSSQFGCFVMDDWDWKQSWETSNKRYTGKP